MKADESYKIMIAIVLWMILLVSFRQCETTEDVVLELKEIKYDIELLKYYK